MANSLGTFEEIINAIKFFATNDKSTRDAVNGVARANAISNVSIASRSKLNVCQFPLLTSSIISVNTYQKVREVLEQLYAQYLKLVIVNQLEVINLGDGDNKLSIISKVHQNDNALSTYMDRNRDEILKADITSRFEDAVPFLEMYNFTANELIKANNELLKPYNENFNLANLNQTNVLSEASIDPEIKSIYDRQYDLIAAFNGYNNRIDEIDAELQEPNDLSASEKSKLEKEKKEAEERIKQINEELDNIEKVLKSISSKHTLDQKAQKRAEEALDAKRKKQDIKDKEKFRKQFGSVTDFDNALIKKNNSLEPSILSFVLKYHTKGGSFEDTKMSLAVKTITHMIDHDELCFYINETLNKNKKTFRAIQILTGEKEFSWRFLLGLDKAKRDAKADSTTAKWWRHLQNRRTASWIKSFRHKDPFVPNATIVLSYDDYETLKLLYKKDLIKDTKSAYRLTDLLFLMHLVIVNEVSNEIMIFDKDTRGWETYTLDKLQNEISTMNKMSANKTLR